MKKTIPVALLFLLLSAGLQAYTLPADTLQRDSARKSRLLPGPVINYSPETDFIFGLYTLYSFYSGKDVVTRPSFMFLSGLYTLKKQLITDLYLNLWSERNAGHYIIQLSYYKFNYFYYGIGNNTKLKDEVLLNQRRLELSINAEKRIISGFYGGLEFVYKRDLYRGDEEKVLSVSDAVGAGGGRVPRAGFSLIYDSRNSANYATKGQYVKLNYSHTLPILNTDFDFHRFIFETRHFYTFREKHTVGFNTNMESVQGNVPFFELRQMGSPFMMRGYYMGRFRDNNYAAAQLEYRWHAMTRIGFVLFAGTGRVFNSSFSFPGLKPNYGLGIRYFYDLEAGLNIRIDYGLGEKIPGEERMGSFYLSVGEAF